MIDSADGKKPSTPFPAIVGQNELKRALLGIAANPALGGLLVRGEKGTAKSTAVRALVDLLPDQRAVADCPYGCPPDDPANQCDDCRTRDDLVVERRPVPLVTVPLGATRERVVGTLSVADALDGERAFDPGLLARANRGFLYVDEVNLLDDHLVDVLLDAAASGVNRVERDGVSVTHPADFTLIGTMNPEEGDLRPQLRDRFALQATVVGCEDVDDRIEIIDRVLDSGRNPADFAEKYDEATTERTEQLVTARDRLEQGVALPTAFKTDIVELCRDAGVDGHRADIAIARTAMTFAALDDRPKVLQTDVREATELALPHRLQSRPFEGSSNVQDVLNNHFDDEGEGDGEEEDGEENEEMEEEEEEKGEDKENADNGEETACGESSDNPESSNDGNSENRNQTRNGWMDDDQPSDSEQCSDDTDTNGTEQGDDAGQENDQQEGVPLIPGQSRAEIGNARGMSVDPSSVPEISEEDGTRSVAEPSATNRGAQVRTERARSGADIDAATSVRAAAKRGSDRVTSNDLRRSVRSGTASTLVVCAVDASASMHHAMRAAKGTVLELLKNAYEQRDEIAFVAFAGEDAEVLLPPTDSVTLAARHLKELPTGDRTPLPTGLLTTGRVIARADPTTSIVVLITDGRANVASESPTEETRNAARQLGEHAHVVVVDANTNANENRASLCRLIAEESGGEHIPLSALSAERIDATVSRESN
jgi:magnesium chelatase subunit D